MARSEPDLFGDDGQASLFGEQPTPAYCLILRKAAAAARSGEVRAGQRNFLENGRFVIVRSSCR